MKTPKELRAIADKANEEYRLKIINEVMIPEDLTKEIKRNAEDGFYRAVVDKFLFGNNEKDRYLVMKKLTFLDYTVTNHKHNNDAYIVSWERN